MRLIPWTLQSGSVHLLLTDGYLYFNPDKSRIKNFIPKTEVRESQKKIYVFQEHEKLKLL